MTHLIQTLMDGGLSRAEAEEMAPRIVAKFGGKTT